MIFVAADHNGFRLREQILLYLLRRGEEVYDLGAHDLDPNDDFNIYASEAVKEIREHKGAVGILVCGGGQGMAMTANRFSGMRAAVVWDLEEAEMARNDNDANILCLPARYLEERREEWQAIIDKFLDTPFAKAARYVRRNNALDKLGEGAKK
ncbi:MAG: RpiB/LacA/LacB family sugar-phosphate isomerase [Candidatus Nomurabacteria bacterium]|jgi:ribose 5-phosphate isomerase B|nr:RpiB/LacA/LacB family sugar-phosphate isomerase [Candidatus Nomurabacteria bacterium]